MSRQRIGGELLDLLEVNGHVRILETVQQTAPHAYNAYEHTMMVYRAAIVRGASLFVCVVALLHDVGKKATLLMKGERATFPKHGEKGAELVPEILGAYPDLCAEFGADFVARVAAFVDHHMWPLAAIRPENAAIGDGAIRRWLRDVKAAGLDWLDVFQLAECDLVGLGATPEYTQKEIDRLVAFRLRVMALEVADERAAATPKPLLTGDEVAKALGLSPGKELGAKVKALAAYVAQHPDIAQDKTAQLAVLPTL